MECAKLIFDILIRRLVFNNILSKEEILRPKGFLFCFVFLARFTTTVKPNVFIFLIFFFIPPPTPSPKQRMELGGIINLMCSNVFKLSDLHFPDNQYDR